MLLPRSCMHALKNTLQCLLKWVDNSWYHCFLGLTNCIQSDHNLIRLLSVVLLRSTESSLLRSEVPLMSQCLKKLNEKLNLQRFFYSKASLLKIRSAGEGVILLSIFRFCLNFSRSTFAVSIIDLSEMTENVETEVALPVEMADTETQLLDNLLRCSYTEMKFDIIRKRKRKWIG